MTQRAAGNWLAGFKFFTSESESPNNYLYWSAMIALSGALRRRVWVKWRYTPIYPNIYVKLVGPPGVGKGQAISFARGFLNRAKIPVSAESGSREGLILDLIEKKQIQEIDGMLWETSPYVVMSPDFMSFYRTSGDAMIEFLTEIYDSGDFDDEPWKYKLRNRPEEQVPKPYVVMIAGTTESWMSENFGVAFTEQGYAARVLFVYANKARFLKARPKITTEMWDMREKLVADLNHITNLTGEFHVPERTWQWFEDWYHNKWPAQRMDYRLSGYLQRKPLQLWKTAMISQIAQSDELVLTPEIMQFALAQLEALEPSMAHAFQGVGRNPISGNIIRIYQDIVNEGRMTKGQLIERYSSDLNSQQLDEVVQNLTLMKKIVADLGPGGELTYRPIKPK